LSEKRSGDRKSFPETVMREEIAILAGPRQWGDNKASWLARVPAAVKAALGTAKQTVSCRTVKAIWYGEITDPEHHAARDIKKAAELISARNEARALAEKFQGLAGGMNAADSNLYRAEIARLEHTARLLGAARRLR
jgi:hypothetical protein